ncbi:MAG: DUF2800 domain-containing protein [Rikenellaceae bacterium]|nr:DUF2800 domain-containing protein [Rikenellaceae bacterium]
MSGLANHSDRAHALLSASSSSRWLKCPPSAVAASLYPSTDTVYTREGTLAHEVAELVARLTDDVGVPSPEGATSEMIECAFGYREYIQEQIKSPDAVVLLEQRLDFSPWVPDGFGTGDCLILQGRHLDVIDYKYGQGVEVSAVGNSQMRLYGLGALHEFGKIYDVDSVTLHIFQPRKDNISTETLSASELLAWGAEIRPVAADAAVGAGEHTPGDHCRFCPHAGACPALADACTHEFFASRGLDAVPSLSEHQVAAILKQEAMITAWLKAVKDRALSSLLEGAEIPGFKVVAGRTQRTWADELEVVAALEKAGYTREQLTKTEVLSPAAMERFLGKKKAAELIAGHIVSNPGAPTVVPESDKRPVFDRLAEAKKDFN